MKKFSKLFSLLLTVVLAFTLVACGSDDSSDGGTTPGGTGPKGQNMLTMVYFIVENLRNLDSIEYSAAGAVVLFAIIMVFTVIQNQVSKKRVHY